MNWKFWKWDRIDMVDLVPEGDYTVGDIIETMTDAQLAVCFYVADREYREILEVVIKNRLRKRSRQTLNELTELSQELGLYDKENV